jgi:predicted nucleotidyltransferase
MSQLGTRVKTLRENKNITLIEAGKAIGCDSGLLSKMERGQRAIPKNLLEKLAKYYKVEIEELNTLWLCDRIYSVIKDEPTAKDALILAERQVEYSVSRKLKVPSLKDLKGKIKACIAEVDEVKTAFVFGSYAKGNQTNDSDIDILIELKNKNKFSYFDLLKLKHQIELSIGITVDIGFYKGLKGNLNELVEPTLIKIYECRN